MSQQKTLGGPKMLISWQLVSKEKGLGSQYSSYPTTTPYDLKVPFCLSSVALQASEGAFNVWTS